MLVTLLMGLVTDLIFESAASMRRSFSAEMARYIDSRGFRSTPPKHTPAR